MRAGITRCEAEGRRGLLSTAGLVVRVETAPAPCPLCSKPTVVQKVAPRNVVTLEHGAFLARVTIRVCARKCKRRSGQLVTLRSEVLSWLVAPGAVYGYDVEVRVGLARFVDHRQREEIRRECLERYGIWLSEGEISLLGRRFLKHLAQLHRSRRAALREALKLDGAYPLQFDATGEDGRGTLLTVYTGWRRWVLGAAKVPTEREDQITPRLREVVAAFGPPCALLHDLGKAVRLAASKLLKKLGITIPNLACHQHFLADVGKDLLRSAHDKLRGLFRRGRLRPGLRKLVRDLGRRLGKQLPPLREEILEWAKESAEHMLPRGASGLAAVRSLAQWVLDSARDGNHLGFPFERPYLDLYRRSRKVRRAVDAFLRSPPGDPEVRRALRRLARLLEPVRSEAFEEITAVLIRRGQLFDELRDVLRLNPHGSPEDLLAQSPIKAAAELQDIRKALEAFRRSLRRRRPARGPAEDTRKAIDLVLEHLERHGRSLWGHVIKLPARAGGGIRVVPRTNNLLEGYFRLLKHGERRRSGRKVLTDDFERLPAEAALAYNLTQPDYVKIICGSLEKLPRAFAALEVAARARTLAKPPRARDTRAREPDVAFASLPLEDRKIVRAESLGRRIAAAATSRAPYRSVSLG